MTKAVSVSIIAAFVGMAVFSIFLMAMDATAGHGSCLARLANGGACPTSNLLSYLTFHFDAFKLFSTAIFATGIISLAFLTFVFGLPKLASPVNNPRFYPRYLNSPKPAAPFKKQLIRWLSLHNQSPSY